MRKKMLFNLKWLVQEIKTEEFLTDRENSQEKNSSYNIDQNIFKLIKSFRMKFLKKHIKNEDLRN